MATWMGSRNMTSFLCCLKIQMLFEFFNFGHTTRHYYSFRVVEGQQFTACSTAHSLLHLKANITKVIEEMRKWHKVLQGDRYNSGERAMLVPCKNMCLACRVKKQIKGRSPIESTQKMVSISCRIRGPKQGRRKD